MWEKRQQTRATAHPLPLVERGAEQLYQRGVQ